MIWNTQDDTLLMALTSTQLQGMLSALESVAQEYGMNLNQSKNRDPHPPHLRPHLAEI